MDIYFEDSFHATDFISARLRLKILMPRLAQCATPARYGNAA